MPLQWEQEPQPQVGCGIAVADEEEATDGLITTKLGDKGGHELLDHRTKTRPRRRRPWASGGLVWSTRERGAKLPAMRSALSLALLAVLLIGQASVGLCTMPGTDPDGAEMPAGEMGHDMSRGSHAATDPESPTPHHDTGDPSGSDCALVMACGTAAVVPPSVHVPAADLAPRQHPAPFTVAASAGAPDPESPPPRHG